MTFPIDKGVPPVAGAAKTNPAALAKKGEVNREQAEAFRHALKNKKVSVKRGGRAPKGLISGKKRSSAFSSPSTGRSLTSYNSKTLKRDSTAHENFTFTPNREESDTQHAPVSSSFSEPATAQTGERANLTPAQQNRVSPSPQQDAPPSASEKQHQAVRSSGKSFEKPREKQMPVSKSSSSNSAKTEPAMAANPKAALHPAKRQERKTGGLEPVDPRDAAAYVQAMAQQGPGVARPIHANHPAAAAPPALLEGAAHEMIARLSERVLVAQSGGETKMRVDLASTLLPGTSAEITRLPAGGVEMAFSAPSLEAAQKLGQLQQQMAHAVSLKTGQAVRININYPGGELASVATTEPSTEPAGQGLRRSDERQKEEKRKPDPDWQMLEALQDK